MDSSFIGFIVWLISIFIAYTVIKTAVRHGIDSSETHELLQQIHGQKDDQDKQA